MTQWEYLRKLLIDGSDMQRSLIKLGADGWELIIITENDMAIFKRPKEWNMSPEEIMKVPTHLCQKMKNMYKGENLFKRYRNNPTNKLHCLQLNDLYYPIDFCPWCGEAI